MICLLGRDQPGDLVVGVGQRLLHVDRLSEGHGQDRDGEVGVVRDADRARVDVLLHLVEHDPEVAIAWHVGVPRLHAGGVLRPKGHVAERDDVDEARVEHLVAVVPAHPAAADDRDVDLLIRPEDGTRNRAEGRGRGGELVELASGERLRHGGGAWWERTVSSGGFDRLDRVRRPNLLSTVDLRSMSGHSGRPR